MPTRATLPCLVTALVAVALFACADRRSLAPDGAFVVLMDAAPGSLDPRFALSDYGAKLGNLIFSGLVTGDTADGLPELDLALAVENPSPLVYEVTLRRDAVFHDGHPLTARDVVFTYTTLDDVGSPLAAPFRQVAVTALDDYRVRFELTEPNVSFLLDLRLGILPAHVLASSPTGQFPPDGPIVGSGPFAFVGRRGEHEVVLRAHARYHGGRPALDVLAFRLVRDDNARLLATLAGSADLVQNAVAPLMLPVLDDYPQLEVESAPSFKITYIAFNMRHPILSDVRVRRALAMAIDREAIIAQKFRGLARLATGLLAPQHWAYDGDVPTWGYDPEAAAALLDEAGYPRGPGGRPRFRLVFKVSANKFRRSIAQLIAYQLGAIGVEVEVQAYEWGTFFGDVRSGNFELATLQWPSVADPEHFRYVFHSTSIPWANEGRGANRGGYASPELDALLDAAARELDPVARQRLYGDVQRLVAADLPYLFLWHEDNVLVTHRGLHGYRMTPNARFRYLAEAWR
jgi:peptide/nickel transport system substrate-binding protein